MNADQALAWVGLGWRAPHAQAWQAHPPRVGFAEVHAENFFLPDGGARQHLLALRRQYPVSLHAVGLGLGSACGLDRAHLAQLATLTELVDPVRVSDHVCFSRAPVAGLVVHGADLLPIAFNEATWRIMASHIQQVQDTLKRHLLVENLSAYLRHEDDTWQETDFLNRLCEHTGCQLLVDLNNAVVNALNWSPQADPAQVACQWLDQINPRHVGQLHLAGHRLPTPGQLVIDDHSQCVNEPVWAVYRHALQRWGPRPTLIEWDVDLPELAVLQSQADLASQALQACAWGTPS